MKPDAIIRRIETLPVTQGKYIGERVKLMPFQKRFIRGAFKNGVDTAALTCARANGKSTLIALIVTAFLLDEDTAYNADIVVIASSFNQSRIIFDAVKRTLEETVTKESLDKGFRIQDSQNNASILRNRTGLRLRCIGSDNKRAMGLQFFMCIADESSSWIEANQKSEKQFVSISTALGKIPNSKLIAISTKPVNTEHWFNRLLKDKTTGYSQEHSVPLDCKTIHQYRTIKKANPAIDYFPDLKAQIKRESTLARKDSNLLHSFRAYRLNQGVEDVGINNYLIEPENWRRVEVKGFEGERGNIVVFGLDLSGGAALSALSVFYVESGYLESMAILPSIPDLKEKGKKDGVGNMYIRFAEEGSLITSTGESADIKTLLETGILRYGEPDVIVADSFRMDLLKTVIRDLQLGCEISERRMGPYDGANDLIRFRRMVLDGKIKAKKQLIMRHCLSGARTVFDINDNERVAKNTQGNRSLRTRDDCAISAMLAVASGSRIQERLNQQDDFEIVIV